MSSIHVTPLWYASGLRWIASLFETLADWLEHHFSSHERANSQDLHFDSDVYLAQVRNEALRRYY
jgi:hypothetical protein